MNDAMLELKKIIENISVQRSTEHGWEKTIPIVSSRNCNKTHLAHKMSTQNVTMGKKLWHDLPVFFRLNIPNLPIPNSLFFTTGTKTYTHFNVNLTTQ